MNSLEALLNAEATLMSPDEPFNFADWPTCTCGHIYHGVTSEYGDPHRVMLFTEGEETQTTVYQEIMKEVAEALGLRVSGTNYPQAISDHTKTASGILQNPDDPYAFPYHQVTREDSLKVIREAITKIRALDENARLRVIDPHTYGLDHGA